MELSSPVFYIPAIFLSLVAVLIAFLYKEAKKNTRDSNECLPFFDEVERSMDYIERNILENGRFVYRNHVESSVVYDNNIYNSLRHAGVLYSMYLYEKYANSDKYKDSRLKATEYFIKKYIKQLEDQRFYVLTNPEEENLKIPIAKSGASGVALCALCNLYGESDLISKDLLIGLGEFLLSMVDEDGCVYAYYDLTKDEPNKEAQAVFYPGEVASGLLYLYEVDNQQKWLDTAKKILLKMAKNKKHLELDVEFDNWSLLAIEKLFESNLINDVEKGNLISYAEQMTISILSNQITNKNHSYFGAFKDNIRPCSLGTIMEGLSSVYLFSNSKNLKLIIKKSLSICCYFLARVQVKTGNQAGGLPNSANWVKPGVTPNAGQIRIDNVQHVVSGWLKFQYILKTTGEY